LLQLSEVRTVKLIKIASSFIAVVLLQDLSAKCDQRVVLSLQAHRTVWKFSVCCLASVLVLLCILGVLLIVM
jgi:hypothetical protein